MKSAILFLSLAFNVSAHAGVDIVTRTVSSFSSGQAATDLKNALKLAGAAARKDVQGYDALEVYGEVLFPKGYCTDKSPVFFVKLTQYFTDTIDDREYTREVSHELDRGNDPCHKSSVAADFAKLLGSWGATQLTDAVGSYGFRIECGTNTPVNSAPFDWCSAVLSVDGVAHSSGDRVSDGGAEDRN